MTPFGTASNGCRVDALKLSAHGLDATVLTLGAILQSLRLDGVPYSLTVGSNHLSDYEGAMKYHGSIVGPVANRISNATATINKKTHHFDTNFICKHTLHGGQAGTHTRIWHATHHEPNRLDLTLDLFDGDGGFPGNRNITARFDIIAGPILRLSITTKTDAPSIANLTNHSYWNLDGTDHMRHHSLRIKAAMYLPIDNESVVTGVIAPVKGTLYDFSAQTPLTLGKKPLDNTFCLSDQRRPLTEVLCLKGRSGISMNLATTEAGTHIFDSRPTYDSIAIEAQGWPDAPNKRSFPSIRISPNAPITQVTQWRFTR
ncbi:MAG: galactose mutarotase [Octadecabacter sp.]|nr:galactose mutarotase [Octadecabacter sp.]